jgi:hypothetical protein
LNLLFLRATTDRTSVAETQKEARFGPRDRPDVMFARRGLLALLLSGLPLAFGRQVTSLATSDVVSTSMRNDVQVVTLQTVLHMGLTSRIMSTETAAGRIYTETLMSTFSTWAHRFGGSI